MLFLTSRAPPSTSSAGAKKNRPEHDESLLRYVLNEVVSGTSGNEAWPPEFRENLFALLLRLFQLNPSPDYNSITTVWVQSNEHEACADALIQLLEAESYMEAYQIGFDLFEVAGQAFVQEVRKHLRSKGWASNDNEVSHDSWMGYADASGRRDAAEHD